jgi:hypothetical protein
MNTARGLWFGDVVLPDGIKDVILTEESQFQLAKLRLLPSVSRRRLLSLGSGPVEDAYRPCPS